MEKTKKFVLTILILITLTFLFTGCTSKNKQSIQVDTIPIVKFTDEKFGVDNNDIIQKSISQRTNDVTTFVVEYWYKSANKNEICHYGYIVKLDNEEIIIIKEGEDINNKVFLE